MEQSVSWLTMPPEVMQKIFLFLPDPDRCSAMLVCQRWREVFQVAELWRLKSFDLTAGRINVQKALLYLKQKGQHLRHLRVKLKVKLELNQKQRYFEVEEIVTLLNACQTADLESLEILRTVPATYNDRMEKALFELLRCQKGLKYIKLSCYYPHHRYFIPEEPFNVLTALSSLRTLTEVDLVDFFPTKGMNTINFTTSTFVEMMGKFGAVKILHLNYDYLSPQLLEMYTTGTGDGVATLHLYKCWQDFRFWVPQLENEHWAAAVERNPKLRATLRVEYADLTLLTRLLPRAMPLDQFTCKVFQDEDPYYAPANALAALGLLQNLSEHFSDSLTSVCLDFEDPTAVLEDSEMLVQMVSRCRLLRRLNINMSVTRETARRVLHAAAQHKLSSGVTKLEEKLETPNGPVILSYTYKGQSSS